MIRRPPRSTLFPYDALPISLQDASAGAGRSGQARLPRAATLRPGADPRGGRPCAVRERSEEHTSELQSQSNLVCRLLLEIKKTERSYSLTDCARHAPRL